MVKLWEMDNRVSKSVLNIYNTAVKEQRADGYRYL